VATIAPRWPLNLRSSGSIAPYQGVYRGAEGIREFVDDQWGMFQALRVEPEEFLTRGRHVIVPITVHSRAATRW
jgi:hypothetical protein